MGLRIQQSCMCEVVYAVASLGLIRGGARNINVTVVPIEVIAELLGRESPTEDL